MRLAIIDDEPKIRLLLRSILIENHQWVEVVGEAGSVKDGLQLIQETKPQMLLLDVEMNDGTGFDVMDGMLDSSIHVVFITAFDHYAVKALRAEAVDYLEKPLNPNELDAALHKVKRLVDKGDSVDSRQVISSVKAKIQGKIAVPTRTGLIYLEAHQILFIKASGSYAEIHLDPSADPIIVSRNLTEIYPALEGLGFIRVHRSYLINTSKIKELNRTDGGYVILSDRQRIPISKQFKEEVVQRIKTMTTIL